MFSLWLLEFFARASILLRRFWTTRCEPRISSDQTRAIFQPQTDRQSLQQADRPDQLQLNRYDFPWRTEPVHPNRWPESRYSPQFRQCPRFPARKKYAPHAETAAVSMQTRVRGRRSQ